MQHSLSLFAFLVLFDLDWQDCPPDLNSMRLPSDFQTHLFLFHKRPEFRLVVKQVEIAVYVLDKGVASRYWDVCYPDFTLMTSAEFYSLWWHVLDYHHAFWFLTCSLQNYIISHWLFEG